MMVLHKSASEQCCSTRLRLLHTYIDRTSEQIRHSRVSALSTLWFKLTLQPYLFPVVRKREFVISLDLGTYTSMTRTAGDRLTLLYLHLTTRSYIHCCTIIRLTTRTRRLERAASGKRKTSPHNDGGERGTHTPVQRSPVKVE